MSSNVDAVEIVRSSGKPIGQVANELGIYDSTLGNWVRQDEINRGEREGLSTDERENARLRMERDRLQWSPDRKETEAPDNVGVVIHPLYLWDPKGEPAGYPASARPYPWKWWPISPARLQLRPRRHLQLGRYR